MLSATTTNARVSWRMLVEVTTSSMIFDPRQLALIESLAHCGLIHYRCLAGGRWGRSGIRQGISPGLPADVTGETMY